MTTLIEAPPEPTLHRLARLPVLAVAGLVAAAHLAVAWRPGWWLDEAPMLAIGRHHLDWGSADQPPMAPLIAAAMDAIAPGSVLVLRLPAVAATAAAVVLAALVARELGADGRAQTLTAAATATGLWTAFAGHWLTPYVFEPLQWLVLVWLLVRWQRLRDDRMLPVLGVVLGVAAQTKFQVLLLAVVLLVAVLVCGPRELLRRPMLWVGAVLAALIAAPTLLWQAVNGWPQLQMAAVVRSEAEYLYQGRSGVAVALVLSAGVMGTVLVLYGLWRALRTPDLRWLGVAFIVLYAVFVIAPGRPYYLVGLHGALAAAGALGLQRRREAGRTRLRWVAWPAAVLSAVVAAGVLAVSVPSASPVVGDRIAAEAVRAYRALPPEQQARTVVMGGSYILAGFLDVHPPAGALPPVSSTSRSYGWFPPPREDQDTVLYVGDPAQLRPYFTDARPLGPVGDGPDATPLWLLTGHRASWTSTWPELRNLTVS